ncbi:unnamed protein product [Protopolystoma xenopodis]|uniref:Uncharacterized protein n=1 Tax=Protopolystoma xenopodis TaxID=117903 RepID=A0A3S5CJM2_9PLAT|nr:unnamed protein product [Protopolystoma xenopodis]
MPTTWGTTIRPLTAARLHIIRFIRLLIESSEQSIEAELVRLDFIGVILTMT